jgi:cephalosporin-C deacetylase
MTSSVDGAIGGLRRATTAAAPEDFEEYWNGMLTELESVPVAAELTENPLRSTDDDTFYAVRLTSVGPYRIFAHYSVPHGDGPFPVLYQLPWYGSVNLPLPHEQRQRYICVQLCHRGQRLADEPFAAEFPGLLTTGIDDPVTYIFRGIVADCCRVVDFLLTRREVDRDRIALIGNDLALLTAALRPDVDAIYTEPAIFYDARQLSPQTQGYPLEELNDYVRTFPERSEAVWRTLSYFDPIHFAPSVRCDTLMVSGSETNLFAPATMRPLMEVLGKKASQYISTYSLFKDGVHREAWLRERYGFSEPLLPPHWR